MDDGTLPPKGTAPRILREAIRVGLCVGTLSNIEDRMYWLIREFLTAKFGAEFIQATDPEVRDVLDRLLKEISVDWKFSNGGLK